MVRSTHYTNNMSDSLALKYRPRNLDKVIGHTTHVERLQGIIASKKYPSTILFVGPSSAGKTTLARAFTASLFGVKQITGHPDYKELNSSDSRGIDDVRDILRVAKLRPRTAPKRVILLDEAQGFTGPSADLLLKPLEEPPAGTLFILGSMEPEKLKQAMKNRASQFVLGAPTREDLTKYVKRIIKGEEMKYMTDELIARVVENSNGEMRSAANILESVQQMAGTGKKVKADAIEKALASHEDSDDDLAVELLVAIYKRKIGVIYKTLLNVQNGFMFINKLLTMNRFLINNTVLKGEKHKAVWWSKANMEVNKLVKETFREAEIDGEKMLAVMTLVHHELIDLKREAGAFMVQETDAVAYRVTKAMRIITPMFKKA